MDARLTCDRASTAGGENDDGTLTMMMKTNATKRKSAFIPVHDSHINAYKWHVLVHNHSDILDVARQGHTAGELQKFILILLMTILREDRKKRRITYEYVCFACHARLFDVRPLNLKLKFSHKTRVYYFYFYFFFNSFSFIL